MFRGSIPGFFLFSFFFFLFFFSPSSYYNDSQFIFYTLSFLTYSLILPKGGPFIIKEKGRPNSDCRDGERLCYSFVSPRGKLERKTKERKRKRERKRRKKTKKKEKKSEN